jgi:hypothetical protein
MGRTLIPTARVVKPSLNVAVTDVFPLMAFVSVPGETGVVSVPGATGVLDDIGPRASSRNQHIMDGLPSRTTTPWERALQHGVIQGGSVALTHTLRQNTINRSTSRPRSAGASKSNTGPTGTIPIGLTRLWLI